MKWIKDEEVVATSLRVSKGFVRKRGSTWHAYLSVCDKDGTGRTQRSRTTGVPCGPNDKGYEKALAVKDAWRDKVLVELAFEEAEERLNERVEEITGAGDINVSALSENFCDYALAFVQRKYDAGQIEPRTAADYRATIHRIAPILGDRRVSDIRTRDMEALMAELNSRGFSKATIKKTFNTCNSALSYAAVHDGLPKNPMQGLPGPGRPLPRRNALTHADTTRMLETLGGLSLTEATFVGSLVLRSGLRSEEVCGLRWRRSPWRDNHCIRVEEVIGRGFDGCYVKQPKTRGSARRIPENEELRQLFSDWYDRVCEDRRRAGELAPGPDDYVIGRPDGSFTSPQNLSKKWSAVSRALGICGEGGQPPTLHDLRHTFATGLVASGVDVKTAAAILGHTSVQTTLDIYASVDTEQLGIAMGRMGAWCLGTQTEVAGQADELLEVIRKLVS